MAELKAVRRELAGWGNYPRAVCDVAQLAEFPGDVDRWAGYDCLTPRGMGRSYGDASLPPSAGVALDTTLQNQIVQFQREKGVLTAQAGTTLATILNRTIAEGWFLPVTPGTKYVTLGGALAANVHGKNHHRVGAIENFVEEFSILTEQGPQQCSPAKDRELFAATVGGFGMTGIIQTVTLRLKRIETAWIKARTFKVRDFDQLMAQLVDEESKHDYSLVWLDTTARLGKLGRGIAMFGDHAAVGELPSATRRRALENRWRCEVRSPAPLRGWGGRIASNSWVNAGYYHWPRIAERLVRIDSYFYPLDALLDWNTLYGSRGFVQYQCVLPRAREAVRGLRRILEVVARFRAGSLVAGMKSMQNDRVLLPFGMDGYTLGIDFDRSLAGLDVLLNQLDRIVLDHGGRVALSKDARLPAGIFREMYPEYPQWIGAVRNYAPQARFRSRLADRLEWRRSEGDRVNK